MTTNAGASEMSKMAIGFGREMREGEDAEAINRLFTPEFRNRLDAVIGFAALGIEVVYRVVEKFIRQLEEQLGERNVSFKLTDAARKWLADKGYDPLYGARPLGRVIQRHVKQSLADELLFGRLVKGGQVGIDVKDGALVFDIVEAKRPPRPAAEDEDQDDDARIPEPVE
jgi:ATP-dependent Clp protease ATP-binding subunit ClpA